MRTGRVYLRMLVFLEEIAVQLARRVATHHFRNRPSPEVFARQTAVEPSNRNSHFGFLVSDSIHLTTFRLKLPDDTSRVTF
jgi:hypothetical protein